MRIPLNVAVTEEINLPFHIRIATMWYKFKQFIVKITGPVQGTTIVCEQILSCTKVIDHLRLLNNILIVNIDTALSKLELICCAIFFYKGRNKLTKHEFLLQRLACYNFYNICRFYVNMRINFNLQPITAASVLGISIWVECLVMPRENLIKNFLIHSIVKTQQIHKNVNI